MNRSSTSNSSDHSTWPRPTKSLVLALLILMGVRLALALFDSDIVTYIDSRRTRDLFRNDLKSERFAPDPPEIILIGTSRMQQIQPKSLAEPLGLNEHNIANLASPGADFVYIETVMRRNPEVLRNAKVIVLDVMPMQAVGNFNYDERGEFFLRVASLTQRLHAQGALSKLTAIADLIVPARSHAQDPYQWRKGFARIGMTLENRELYLDGVSLDQFDLWLSHRKRLDEFDQRNELVNAFAEMLFASPETVPNQTDALHRIVDMTPENCKLILLWLPFRNDVRDIAAKSSTMTASRAKFKKLLEDLDDPKVQLTWIERPEDMGISDVDYNADGVHFSPPGVQRVTQIYASLITNLL